MKFSPTLRTSFLLIAALCTSCANLGSGDVKASDSTPVAQEAKAKTPDPDKLFDLEHKLEMSKGKVDIFELKRKGKVEQQAIQLAHEQLELEMARAKLANFKEVELVSRRAKAELDLQSNKDRAEDAAAELEQTELMYKEADLADQTREYVITRGRRDGARAERRLAIQETEHKSTMEFELPLELKKLELAVRKAEEDLAKLKFDAEIETRSADLERREAVVAVHNAERALEKCREGDKE